MSADDEPRHAVASPATGGDHPPEDPLHGGDGDGRSPGGGSQGPLPPPWDRIFSLGTRLFVWGLLASLLYLLRPFFLLVFLTFVFAYILEHGTEGLRHRITNRPFRVVIVALVFIGTLVSSGILLAPAFQKQARKIALEFPTYLASIDEEVQRLRSDSEMLRDLIPHDMRTADLIARFAGVVERTAPDLPPKEKEPKVLPIRVEVDPDFVGPPAPYTVVTPPTEESEVVAARSQEKINELVEIIMDVASPILGVTSSFLLSLLFAFLIVLDLPRLSRAVHSLAKTKIGFIYEEAAGNIHDFGAMLGRALEAQFLIAICNTVLTAIGLWLLGMTDNVIFLATIVFFFSFIPVVGVFISSTPICLEALSVDGVGLMFAAVLMITIIHMIEAYVLNPRIFGHHLHMNPVLVLIVLTIAGKLAGIWGLILGLPVVNYVFKHAIRHSSRPAPAAEAKVAATKASSGSSP